MRRTQVILLGTVCLLVALATGTGGFTATQIERTHAVRVAGQGDAYLDVTTYDGLRCGPREALTVHNQFPGTDLSSVEATVTDSSDSVRVHRIETPPQIRAGQSGDVRVWLSPTSASDDETTAWITFRVRATGGDAAVAMARTVTVDCHRNPVQFVTLCSETGLGEVADVSAVRPGDPTRVSWDGTGVTTVVYGTDETAYRLTDHSDHQFRSGEGAPIGQVNRPCRALGTDAVRLERYEYNASAGVFESDD